MTIDEKTRNMLIGLIDRLPDLLEKEKLSDEVSRVAFDIEVIISEALAIRFAEHTDDEELQPKAGTQLTVYMFPPLPKEKVNLYVPEEKLSKVREAAMRRMSIHENRANTRLNEQIQDELRKFLETKE